MGQYVVRHKALVTLTTALMVLVGVWVFAAQHGESAGRFSNFLRFSAPAGDRPTSSGRPAQEQPSRQESTRESRGGSWETCANGPQREMSVVQARRARPRIVLRTRFFVSGSLYAFLASGRAPAIAISPARAATSSVIA